MKTKLYTMAFASIIAVATLISSCGEEKKENKPAKDVVAQPVDMDIFDEETDETVDENAPKATDPKLIKRTSRGKDNLVDENEFYKVYVRWDDYDSISFSVVWMLDKENNSKIIVTDPAPYFYKYAPKYVDAKYWYDDPRLYFSGHRNSIGNATEAKLVSDKKHPWKLALYCHGCQHNFSTLIVSENDTSYKSLDNQSYLGKSKYEDVWFFAMTDQNDSYSTRFNSVLVLYNSRFKEIGRKDLRIDFTKSDGSGKPKSGKAGGVKVDYDNVNNIIGTYDVSWAFETQKKATVYDTKTENGDIVSYVVLQPGNVTYRMPSNDGFLDGVIEDGLLFQSYGTYDDGSRYAILQVFDRKFRLIYEVKCNGRKRS